MTQTRPPAAIPPPARADLDAFTLARAQRGDARACAALVQRYQHAVFAVVGRVTGHGPHVEDLAQDTFLRVFRALPGFNPNGPATLSTWILTIAWRLAVDHLRKHRLPAVTMDSAQDVRSPHATDSATHQRETEALLQRALDALTAEQRATLVLFEFHDLGHADIAQVTQVDVGTVKSRLNRARAAVRALLQGNPP